MTVELPKFQRTVPLVEDDGTPGLAFHRWWQEVANTLEDQLNTINGQIQTLAQDAHDKAVAAAREAARVNSYPNPGSVLTATDAGSDATITIAGHTRVYPVQGEVDVPDVTITGGSILHLSYSTQYFVYYDDTTLANTTPTFLATTNSATAQVGAADGRHFLGFITTPAAAGGPTGGQGSGPPGGGGGGGGGEIP